MPMFKILVLASLLSLHYHSIYAQPGPEFTAVFDSKVNTVTVSWKHSPSTAGTYLIQRSVDNINWGDIALQGAPLDQRERDFSFEDKRPAAGKNYYRLKFIAVNGEAQFSPAIMVIIPAANNWVMYPVPVGDLLTLEYRGTESIKGVINIFIQRNTGAIITRLRSSSLNKLIKIPVNNLGSGIYDVRVIVGGDIVWNQRFIK